MPKAAFLFPPIPLKDHGSQLVKYRRRKARDMLAAFFPRPTRSHHVMLRFSPKEHQQILAGAREAEKAPAVYVREMALEGRVVPEEATRALREFSLELRKIGVNVNQVAHQANASQEISEEELRAFVGMLRRAEKVVREAVKKSEEF